MLTDDDYLLMKAQRIVHLWQERLGLQNWAIRVVAKSWSEMRDLGSGDADASVSFNTESLAAEIRVRREADDENNWHLPGDNHLWMLYPDRAACPRSGVPGVGWIPSLGED